MVKAPARACCAPNQRTAAVPKAVAKPIRILNRSWILVSERVAANASLVVRANHRSLRSSRQKACTTGMAANVCSATSYIFPSASCCW